MDGSLSERSSVSVPALDTWAFDPQSRWIAVLGSGDADEGDVLTLVALGDAGLQTVASRTQFQTIPARAIAFDSGGSRIAVSGLWAVEFFDPSTALPVEPARDIGVDVESIALRADGAAVAAGSPAGSNDRAGLLTLYAADRDRPRECELRAVGHVPGRLRHPGPASVRARASMDALVTLSRRRGPPATCSRRSAPLPAPLRADSSWSVLRASSTCGAVTRRPVRTSSPSTERTTRIRPRISCA